MSTGRFSPIFRTGEVANSAFEQILESINKARGSAYASYDISNTNTAVYVENYAIAKSINELWNTNQRFVNQFDSQKLGVYLNRWEKILGLYSNENDSLQERKDAISLKLSLFNTFPTSTNIQSLCEDKLGLMFLEISKDTSTSNLGGLPGGVNLSSQNGVVLTDENWYSSISNIAIRSWQIRTKDGYIVVDENTYNDAINNLSEILDGWLPAYTLPKFYRFMYQGQTDGYYDAGYLDLDMELPTSKWSGGFGTTLTKDTISRSGTHSLKITRTSAIGTALHSDIIMYAGRKYRITGYCKSDGTALPQVGHLTTMNDLFIGTTSTSWQYFDVTFIASEYTFCIGKNNSGNYVHFDDLTFHTYANDYLSTISSSVFNTKAIIGTNTLFLSRFRSGDRIEVVDDNDVLKTYTIDSIYDDALMTVLEDTTTTTNRLYRSVGFYLDNASNINTLCLK